MTPSTRTSIRCVPLGKLPSVRLTLAVKPSEQPIDVQIFVEQPAPPNAAQPHDHPDPDLPTAHAGKRTPRTGSWLPSGHVYVRLWPELRVAAWRDTYATLMLYGQIVGKIRLALAPKMNQWWNVTFYVTARGLTTSPMPYGDRLLSIDFDFIDHRLVIQDSDGEVRALPLEGKPVCFFYADVMARSRDFGPRVHDMAAAAGVSGDRRRSQKIASTRTTIAPPCRPTGRRCAGSSRVFQLFRSRFRGKCSPVHFFWGAFDLAVTRFVGRRAPARKAKIDRDAYDEEVISLGFWPGDPGRRPAARRRCSIRTPCPSRPAYRRVRSVPPRRTGTRR